MAMHSSTLAWRIPWTEEPAGLWSMGSQELDTTEQLNLSWYPFCSRAKLLFPNLLDLTILSAPTKYTPAPSTGEQGRGDGDICPLGGDTFAPGESLGCPGQLALPPPAPELVRGQ